MIISINNLTKTFTTKKPLSKKFLLPRYEKGTFTAVNDISFSIQAGDRVAFIGPNGAGKSTTLKMLSGILTPTSGHATVAGFIPWIDRKKLAYHIGLVFGQRSQLWYHSPVIQSYDLLSKVYGLDQKAYRQRLNLLCETFKIGGMINQKVSTLSLGQRMKCEIVASLLHNPKILFLDEPTIGLDVTTKAELRDHLLDLAVSNGVTLILTSHDTADIEKICNRVVLINHGEKLIDQSLEEMRRQYLRKKMIVLTTEEENPRYVLPVSWPQEGIHIRSEHYKLFLDVDPKIIALSDVISNALSQTNVLDVSVGDVPLEEIIKHIYHLGKNGAAS